MTRVRVLSFDVAICNLAYCLIELDTDTGKYDVITWEVINLKADMDSKKQDFETTSKKLVQVLNQKFDADLHIDIVLIENQPVIKNPVMKSVQMMIYTFFLIKSLQRSFEMDVKLVSARNKLKVVHRPTDMNIEASSSYQKNKKEAICIANHYLQCILQKDELISLFQQHKKKDDLADCFLQAIWFIETNQKCLSKRT